MRQQTTQEIEPIIEHVAYGDETGINPIIFNGIEHVPYTAETSNRKIHVYFSPRGLRSEDQTTDALKLRALSKIDPRITYRHNGEYSTFHGFLITPEYLGGKFSQPAFDWLMEHCNQINAPVKNTASINKPTIALFLQRQKPTYGFEPDSTDAIAEIMPPKELGEYTRIRWLYNILPVEERRRQVKGYTFYEVVGENGIIDKRRKVLSLGHHVVAMHSPYSRK